MAEDQEPLGPAAQYEHDHPPVQNVNAVYEEKMSSGQRVADRVAAVVGSWPFIILQSVLLLLWMAVNAYLAVMAAKHPGFLKAWDPYPFILLNLMLSFQAAYTGPVVMMSQNRQSEKDRLMAQHDYEINQKAEEEVKVIMAHLVYQDGLLFDALQRLEALHATAPEPRLTQSLEEVSQRLAVHEQRLAALLGRLEKPAMESAS